MKYRINAEDVTLPDGTVRTEADYERMALEAEATEPDEVDLLSGKASRQCSKSASTAKPKHNSLNTTTPPPPPSHATPSKPDD